jgi:hypothetical protein
MHRVSDRRVGTCLEDHVSGLSKEQERRRKAEEEEKNNPKFGF